MKDTRALATRKEVSEHLGIPARTLDTWATRGYGPRYVKVGKHARYRWADVENWLDEHTEGAA